MYGSGEFTRENFMQVLEEAATLARKLGDYIALFYGVGILDDVANWVGEYETAERCGQELLELSRHRPPTFLASCLRIVGEASLGLGKLHLARQQLLESMTVMLKSETRLLINCQVALLAWAKLLYRECTAQKVAHQPCYTQRQQAQALEIVSSLWHEPKARAMYKARAAQFASELEALLPPEVARAAKERGKTKTPVQMATEIVNQT